MTRRTALGVVAAGVAGAAEREVQTVTGPVAVSELGVTLMHEHIVTDLRAPLDRPEADYDAEDAFRVARPFLEELREAGCQTLVEPTPMYIGRAPATLKRLSEAVGLNIICATGIYGAANHKFIPKAAYRATDGWLWKKYIQEIREGIGDTGVRPGLIKTGVNRESPLPTIERTLVRAALTAHKQTGLPVASHTGGGLQALEQLSIAEDAQADPSRMIWVHAQNEKDRRYHLQAARAGMWVEFDGLRERTLDWHLECVLAMAEANLLGRTLVSHDAGWYRPGPERGSRYRGYTFAFEKFLPALRERGFGDGEIRRLMVENPAKALAGSA